jgi:hypothetical protein
MILPYDANPGRMEFSERTGHLVKIDGATDEVVGVITSEDAGWHMPHGNFVAGHIR